MNAQRGSIITTQTAWGAALNATPAVASATALISINVRPVKAITFYLKLLVSTPVLLATSI